MNYKCKPMLACDWYEESLKFPCLAQPKIDGVHALNQHGKLLGRSLKPHENKHVTEKFSHDVYHGFCGEMISGTDPTHPDLCRITSGDLRRRTGEPKVTWYIFDYCTEYTHNLSYHERMIALRNHMRSTSGSYFHDVRVIDSQFIHDLNTLSKHEEQRLNEGYEGVILRDPLARYKFGRCGKNHMGAWRIKRFMDGEILVDSIEEGENNQNEAKVNELGRTERSTHQENMKPSGILGRIYGTLLSDLVDAQTKEVLVKKGERVTVSPGTMTHSDRKHYFENQSEIVGKIVKFKFFPKGIKDKPRFSTFLSIRSEVDMS